LDLKKVLELNDSEQKMIMKLFDDLLSCFDGDRGMSLPGGMKMDYFGAQVLYSTLSEGGFLVTRREKNLREIEAMRY
jgi:hypothetical protein